ncbi:MAG: 30S ribosomal protein S17 [Planctomycetes bacterium]|nr:30S ribosomal protein S17 [Planctomycetota bacterium]
MTTSTDSTQKRIEHLTGVVVSAGGDKTCTVRISRLVKHPLYGKYIKRWSKQAVHDPNNDAGVGDTVDIIPCRPVSKRKRWRLNRVVTKARMG